MSAPDVSEIAVAMLAERLPGFESRISPATDAIVIRGSLPIGATVNPEPLFYAVRRPEPISGFARAVRDVTETDAERVIREAKERRAIERDIAPIVDHIAEQIQRFAIEAVNLAPVIAERERRAHDRGGKEGYAAGKAAGKAEGHADGVRSILRILITSDAHVGDRIREVYEEFGLDDE